MWNFKRKINLSWYYLVQFVWVGLKGKKYWDVKVKQVYHKQKQKSITLQQTHCWLNFYRLWLMVLNLHIKKGGIFDLYIRGEGKKHFAAWDKIKRWYSMMLFLFIKVLILFQYWLAVGNDTFSIIIEKESSIWIVSERKLLYFCLKKLDNVRLLFLTSDQLFENLQYCKSTVIFL